MRKKPYKNVPERNLSELATSNGWRSTKRGWPDFMCIHEKTGEIIAIECKPRLPSGRLQLLKRDQGVCMDFLQSKGIRCFVSDGQKLEPYAKEKHASESLRRASNLARLKRMGK